MVNLIMIFSKLKTDKFETKEWLSRDKFRTAELSVFYANFLGDFRAASMDLTPKNKF
jgi:hypothetical protein